eukprot:CAMPEP_0198427792 /NCGR_PEP_ID=MMETSP1452-20131203/6139_1 /TAXON_ID=1181717 /ORGANISM="Synchroma pusillum, Strain CCMP3072" /LENGTH=356 /DNA_ID=CAMNT_0044148169 /DNA_START=72 /DNA_END=1140 /DNA_ORIENTATION=-
MAQSELADLKAAATLAAHVQPGEKSGSKALAAVGADVHGSGFWKAWTSVGGSLDDYVKENLPSYGLIGALLITVTYAGLVGAPDLSDAAGDVFVVLQTIATMLSVFLIFHSLIMYSSFTSCVDDETRLNFTARYGWQVPAGASLIFATTMLVLVAGLIVVYDQYSRWAFAVSLISVIAFTLCILIAAQQMLAWNQGSNYVPVVEPMIGVELRELPATLEEALKPMQEQDRETVLAAAHNAGVVGTEDLVTMMKELAQSKAQVDGKGRFLPALQAIGLPAFLGLKVITTLEPWLAWPTRPWESRSWVGTAASGEAGVRIAATRAPSFVARGKPQRRPGRAPIPRSPPATRSGLARPA